MSIFRYMLAHFVFSKWMQDKIHFILPYVIQPSPAHCRIFPLSSSEPPNLKLDLLPQDKSSVSNHPIALTQRTVKMSSNARSVPATDPKVYDEYQQKWSSLPTNEAAWLQRAEDVANVLAVDSAQRERDNKSPRAEITLLKYSGLLKVLGWKKYGGGEQPWSVGYKVIREVAKGDG